MASPIHTIEAAVASSIDGSLDRTIATASATEATALLLSSATAPSKSSDAPSRARVCTRSGSQGTGATTHDGAAGGSRPDRSWRCLYPDVRNPVYVVAICMLANFVVETGDYLMRAPFTRALESVVCQRYWDGHEPGRFQGPIDEKWCKAESIQAELAFLKGWDLLFSCLPTILLIIPAGIVADHFGRKLVLFLSLLGLAFASTWTQIVVRYPDVFDVRWFWAGNAFLLLGGGPTVVNSMFFVILADVTPESRRASVFFRFMATQLGATVLAVPLAWYLVRLTIWVPMSTALCLVFVGTFMSLLIPETLHTGLSEIPESQPDPATAPLLGGRQCSPSGSPTAPQPSEDGDSVPSSSILSKLHVSLTRVRKQFAFLVRSPLLITLVCTFLVNSLGQRAFMPLVQYVSFRFGISLSSASLLIPLNASVHFVILFLALPALMRAPVLAHMSPPAKDLRVSQVSVLLVAFGLVGFGLAPHMAMVAVTIVVYALGAGYFGAVRSLATSMVQPDQVGQLYGVLGIVDTIGSLAAGPVMSELFLWGLRLGGAWMGMQFLFIGGLFGLVAVVLWNVSVPS